jgi:hypothetical protein
MRTRLVITGVIGLIIIFGVAVAARPTTSAPAIAHSPDATPPATPTPESPAAPSPAWQQPSTNSAPLDGYEPAPTPLASGQDRARLNPPQQANGATLSNKGLPKREPGDSGDRIAATATVTSTRPVQRATPKPTATIDAVEVTPGIVNGVPLDQFLIMPDTVQQNIRGIYARGQLLGNDPRAVSTAGDSTIEPPYFLSPFGGDKYNLGGYSYLQPTIDTFKRSFQRDSAAVRIGQHAWTVLNPAWADKKRCDANESPLACELRLNRPSLLIIRLGVNDANVSKLFDASLRKIVDQAIEQGVIPILSTKPDQRAGTTGNNDLVRKIAADYHIPLWDYDLVAQTLPGRGLGPDGAHMTGFWQNDYRLAAAYQRGQAMQNLTALMVLDRVWRTLNP